MDSTRDDNADNNGLPTTVTAENGRSSKEGKKKRQHHQEVARSNNSNSAAARGEFLETPSMSGEVPNTSESAIRRANCGKFGAVGSTSGEGATTNRVRKRNDKFEASGRSDEAVVERTSPTRRTKPHRDKFGPSVAEGSLTAGTNLTGASSVRGPSGQFGAVLLDEQEPLANNGDYPGSVSSRSYAYLSFWTATFNVARGWRRRG